MSLRQTVQLLQKTHFLKVIKYNKFIILMLFVKKNKCIFIEVLENIALDI